MSLSRSQLLAAAPQEKGWGVDVIPRHDSRAAAKPNINHLANSKSMLSLI
jgi:hypothetical protein